MRYHHNFITAALTQDKRPLRQFLLDHEDDALGVFSCSSIEGNSEEIWNAVHRAYNICIAKSLHGLPMFSDLQRGLHVVDVRNNLILYDPEGFPPGEHRDAYQYIPRITHQYLCTDTLDELLAQLQKDSPMRTIQGRWHAALEKGSLK
jgi:hypothetical protein